MAPDHAGAARQAKAGFDAPDRGTGIGVEGGQIPLGIGRVHAVAVEDGMLPAAEPALALAQVLMPDLRNARGRCQFEKIGGLSAIRSELPMDWFALYDYGAGLVIQAGPKPEAAPADQPKPARLVLLGDVRTLTETGSMSGFEGFADNSADMCLIILRCHERLICFVRHQL